MSMFDEDFYAITKEGEFVILPDVAPLYGLRLYLSGSQMMRLRGTEGWRDAALDEIPKEFLAWLTLLGVPYKLPEKYDDSLIRLLPLQP